MQPLHPLIPASRAAAGIIPPRRLAVRLRELRHVPGEGSAGAQAEAGPEMNRLFRPCFPFPPMIPARRPEAMADGLRVSKEGSSSLCVVSGDCTSLGVKPPR